MSCCSVIRYFLSATMIPMMVIPTVTMIGIQILRILTSEASEPTLTLSERNVVRTSDIAIPSVSVMASISSGPRDSLSWYGPLYGLVLASCSRWNSTERKSSPNERLIGFGDKLVSPIINLPW